jgi:hypothetical protein
MQQGRNWYQREAVLIDATASFRLLEALNTVQHFDCLSEHKFQKAALIFSLVTLYLCFFMLSKL